MEISDLYDNSAGSEQPKLISETFPHTENSSLKSIQLAPGISENQLAETYYEELRLYLRGKGVAKELLEDVVQDSWIVIIEKLRNNEIRNIGKIRNFIFSVGKNQLIMAFRKDKERFNVEIQEDLIESQVLEPEKQLEVKQTGEQIAMTFSKMRQERDKDILARFLLTPSTKKELAGEYQISLSHFDRVSHRSRKRFLREWVRVPH